MEEQQASQSDTVLHEWGTRAKSDTLSELTAPLEEAITTIEARANKLKTQFEAIMRELNGDQLARFSKLLHI